MNNFEKINGLSDIDIVNTNHIEQQVKSRIRVQKHGEVFTPQWVVNDMLNLLPDDVWKIDKTFLEPACGEGAFLIEIYKRKLQKIPTKDQKEWEWNAAIATSSIYGIELLEDNAIKCRENLIQIFLAFYNENFPETSDEDFIKTVKFLIKNNIIQGNAMTYRKCSFDCGNECSKCDWIIFSEWNPIDNYEFERKDYTYKGIINADEKRKKNIGNIFEAEFSQEESGLIKEYKPVYYKTINYVKN